jgi:hypothetical protein
VLVMCVQRVMRIPAKFWNPRVFMHFLFIFSVLNFAHFRTVETADDILMCVWCIPRVCCRIQWHYFVTLLELGFVTFVYMFC